MSRRKKSSAGRGPGPSPAERNDRATMDRTPPEPNPPRPNKPFLLAAGVLLTAWVAFLIILAVTIGQFK